MYYNSLVGQSSPFGAHIIFYIFGLLSEYLLYRQSRHNLKDLYIVLFLSLPFGNLQDLASL